MIIKTRISVKGFRVLFFIFRDGLIRISGGNEYTTSYAKEYLNVLIFGFIFQFLSYFFTMNMRSEGRPFFSPGSGSFPARKDSDPGAGRCGRLPGKTGDAAEDDGSGRRGSGAYCTGGCTDGGPLRN